jgi:hypothetical protein
MTAFSRVGWRSESVALRVDDDDHENDDNEAELRQSHSCEHRLSSPHRRLGLEV